MPDTMKLGDKYWLVRYIHELDADAKADVVVAAEAVDQDATTKQIEELAKAMIHHCVVEDVDLDSADELTVEQVVELFSTVSGEYDISVSQ